MSQRSLVTGQLFLVILLSVRVSGAAEAPPERAPKKTALDDYVAKPDDSYTWKVEGEQQNAAAATYIVSMTSQTWRTPDEVNRPQWRHWLSVVAPTGASSDIALLWIGGGANGREPPEQASDRIVALAKATGSVVAELGMVPNQPLIFHGDGQERVEDDLIAYTWDQFLESGDPTWLARNPMVKSAVRAMDTLTALTAEKTAGQRTVKKFVVAGGSKRGWTTWITGAVDPRVVSIMPIVIDVVNVKVSMRHHFSAYGFWAPSVGDYVSHGIMEELEHPRMDEALSLVDPYAYRHRLTMPKFIVNAAGDQFFLPDSSRFYFDQLDGEKHLRYVPNADHSLRNSDAQESLAAYHALIVSGKPRPRFEWTEESDGGFHVTVKDKPQRVRLWQATNPEARDFRMETLGPAYTSRELEPEGNGKYIAKISAPERGWTAYFVELEFDVGVGMPLKLTTNVRVVPDTLPYADRDSTKPPTLTVIFDAPNEDVARAIEGELGKLLVAQGLASGKVRTRRTKTQCQVNLLPAGNSSARFRKSGGALAEWLRQKGCSQFQYELHSGPDLTE